MVGYIVLERPSYGQEATLLPGNDVCEPSGDNLQWIRHVNLCQTFNSRFQSVSAHIHFLFQPSSQQIQKRKKKKKKISWIFFYPVSEKIP